MPEWVVLLGVLAVIWILLSILLAPLMARFIKKGQERKLVSGDEHSEKFN